MEVDGYVAFDTATGQLCRSYQSKPAPKTVRPAPSTFHAPEPESSSGDRILDAIRNGSADARAQENAEVEFVRGLPACTDIR